MKVDEDLSIQLQAKFQTLFCGTPEIQNWYLMRVLSWAPVNPLVLLRSLIMSSDVEANIIISIFRLLILSKVHFQFLILVKETESLPVTKTIDYDGGHAHSRFVPPMFLLLIVWNLAWRILYWHFAIDLILSSGTSPLCFFIQNYVLLCFTMCYLPIVSHSHLLSRLVYHLSKEHS